MKHQVRKTMTNILNDIKELDRLNTTAAQKQVKNNNYNKREHG
jgi:hypothetical protein